MGTASLVLLAGLALALTPAQARGDELRERALAEFDAVFSGAKDAQCATAALAGAHAAWDALTPQERHRVDWASSPLYRAAVEAGGPSWLDDGGARATCLLPEDIDGFASYEEAASSEHFVIYRVSGAAPLADTVASTLSLLEEGLANFVARGWREPAGLDAFQMMVFLDSRPPTLGGYTWVSPCEEVGAVDWLVLNEDWARDPERASSLIAHELFHTIQRRYAFDELVAGWDASKARWFAEASAVYEEGLVFPERTELTSVRSGLWSEQPWLALETFNGRREYESFVLLLSIEAALGNADWHAGVWEGVDGRTGWSPTEELGALDSGGFRALFTEYIARAAEMDLPRVDFLVGPRDLHAFNGIDGGITAQYTALELPADGTREPGDPEGPQELGANYVWFGTRDASDGQALRIDVQLDAETAAGEPVDWVVEVVAARAGSLRQRLSVDLDGDAARIVAHGVHATDGVWLIVSPMGPSSAGPPGWSWSGRLVAGESALRLEQTAPGCACDAGGGEPGWLGLLAAAALALRRRRRW